MFCEICKTQDAVFVRDHNHKTGFIRGILCRDCNQRLGTYESDKTAFFKRKKKYKRWLLANEEAVKNYLSKGDTSVKYEGSFRNQIEILKGICL